MQDLTYYIEQNGWQSDYKAYKKENIVLEDTDSKVMMFIKAMCLL